MTKIKWTRTNPGSQRDEGSYYESACGRFSISPTFRHTIYPDGYKLRDNALKADRSCDTIREAKERAVRIADKDEARRQAAYEAANERHPLPISGPADDRP